MITRHDEQDKGADCPSLLCSYETPPGVVYPALGSLAPERHGAGEAGPEKGQKDNPRA